MNIVLVGFMGSGKSSVGRALARAIGYGFVDTDEVIVEQEGRPITAIFETRGEAYFRGLERRVVREVTRRRSVVIATGGGVLGDAENLAALRACGLLVWLKAEPEVLLRRVRKEGATRPLLDVPDPLREIRRLLRRRRPSYTKADISIETGGITVEEAADEIRRKTGLSGDRVRVELGPRSYDILIGPGVVSGLAARLRALRPTKVAVISNPTVFGLCGGAVENAVREAGFEPLRILIPDGENYKDLLWLYKIHGDLLAARFDRRSLLVALGGGVIGDIAGFAASTYMRGIRCVQMPTTLLAQVDSSVGGKTGVNHPLGKNMIGTFFQPSLVVMDLDLLRSLPESELRAGLAEIIKYGVIRDADLFSRLERDRREIFGFGPALGEIVVRSCEIKADVVRRDEREGGLRAILNYGHSFGHAIETLTGYTEYLHGEAVAIGMCVAAEVAARTRRLARRHVTRIRRLVQDYGLPWAVPAGLSAEAVLEAMRLDKKNVGDALRLVLPLDIGRVEIVDGVPEAVIGRAIDATRDK